MSEHYDPNHKVIPYHMPPNSDDCCIDFVRFAEERDDGLFHVGDIRCEAMAPTLYCRHCGGKDFNVGMKFYCIAIRCVKCEWETIVWENG